MEISMADGFLQAVKKALDDLISEHSRITANDPGDIGGLSALLLRAENLSDKMARFQSQPMTGTENAELTVLGSKCEALVAIIKLVTDKFNGSPPNSCQAPII